MCPSIPCVFVLRLFALLLFGVGFDNSERNVDLCAGQSGVADGDINMLAILLFLKKSFFYPLPPSYYSFKILFPH